MKQFIAIAALHADQEEHQGRTVIDVLCEREGWRKTSETSLQAHINDQIVYVSVPEDDVAQHDSSESDTGYMVNVFLMGDALAPMRKVWDLLGDVSDLMSHNMATLMPMVHSHGFKITPVHSDLMKRHSLSSMEFYTAIQRYRNIFTMCDEIKVSSTRSLSEFMEEHDIVLDYDISIGGSRKLRGSAKPDGTLKSLGSAKEDRKRMPEPASTSVVISVYMRLGDLGFPIRFDSDGTDVFAFGQVDDYARCTRKASTLTTKASSLFNIHISNPDDLNEYLRYRLPDHVVTDLLERVNCLSLGSESCKLVVESPSNKTIDITGVRFTE